MENVIKSNKAHVIGKIVSDLTFSHEVYGEGFYMFNIEVSRLSDSVDILPVVSSERLMVGHEFKPGLLIEIEGQFRSYNSYTNNGNRLVLTIFAREITVIEGEAVNKNPNQIFLDGYVCKAPVYRTTPFGREITDLLIAVNRPYNKSDYIPCIAWGRNARFAEKLEVGAHIHIWGRIQSREYQKKFENGEAAIKTAFEVSVSKMEVVKDEVEEEVIEVSQDATIPQEE